MGDGYLSKDREHLNRMQRERRARLVRIDFHPEADVLALIEAKRAPFGVASTNSGTLNAIVREWAEATGIKWREVDSPDTSEGLRCNAGINRPVSRARQTSVMPECLPRSSGDGGTSANADKQRVPCGAKRRRDGQPCQALSVPGKRRCKWHGGHSTGPKTPEGKARALANLLLGRGLDRSGVQ